MTSEKQFIANQTNAQLSTGPVTAKGKMVVSTNAIKHGIFTKDLILSSSLGKESEADYQEMLNNLIECLLPQNQMESLLVEKIAIDFWRLRRVIRFETGSIADYIATLFKDFYSYSRRNNEEINKEIEIARQYIIWIASYVEHLKKEEVSFEQPIWQRNDIESDISEDFYLIAKTINELSRTEKEKLQYGGYHFNELKELLKKNGYSSIRDISTKLLEIYGREIQRLEKEIKTLECNKFDNEIADRLNTMLGMIPQDENTDKVLKYERSIQKSIFQNLILLKKLQEQFKMALFWK